MTSTRDPVEPAHRIASIDGLRGLALIGILLMNMVGFGGSVDLETPFGAPDLANPDWRVWIVEQMVFEGAMRGLFSMLFGAGMLLFLREDGAGGGETAGRGRLFLKRSAWLVLFGVVNGTLLLWPGDILVTYGLAAMLILPLARVRSSHLIGVAVAVIALLSVWLAWIASGPAYELLTRTSPDYLAERSARLGGYREMLAFMAETTWLWTTDIFTLWWVLEAASFMLLGMALLRAGILNGKAGTRTYGMMLAGGLAVALPLNAAETLAVWRAGGLALPWTEFTSQIGRLALTLAWIGLFHLAWRALPRLAFAPLAALGRMALTGYLGQSVICAIIFGGFGLGLWDQLSWPQRWLLVIPIMAFEAVFAMLWLGVFRFGPVEWLWRSLTYGRPQPMRRRAVS